jgi:hypothetical protein
MIILASILKGFKQMLEIDFKICTISENNIWISIENPDKINVKIIDLIDICNCDDNIEINILESLNDILGVYSENISTEPFFIQSGENKIWNNKIKKIDDALQMVSKIIENEFKVKDYQNIVSVLPIQDISTMGQIKCIVRSGGGDICSTTNDKIVFKDLRKLTQNDLNHVIESLYKNGNIFVKMKKSKYLTPPLTIVTENNIPIGYTMENLKNYETIEKIRTKSNFKDKKIFLTILKNILEGFQDIQKAGFKQPCVEHEANVMVYIDNLNNINVKIIDLDDTNKCDDNSEVDTLNSLDLILGNYASIINNLSPFFVYDRGGDKSWNREIKTFKDALEQVSNELNK